MTSNKVENMEPVFIKATDLNDAWFQCISKIFDKGFDYKIDKGSYETKWRLEYDHITLHIKHPQQRPLAPEIPPGLAALGVSPPTTDEAIEEYFVNYLMSEEKHPNEDYTYGERLVNTKFKLKEKVLFNKLFENYFKELSEEVTKAIPTLRNVEDFVSKQLKEIYKEYNNKCSNKEVSIASNINQIEEVIDMYKKSGYGTNQAVMEIAMPTDIKLVDPPCLRIIDTRVRYGKLHFVVYFRSWDLWGGLPMNLGGLQLLKEYMSSEIGVEDGEIIAASKGLHLYDHALEAAQIRTYRQEEKFDFFKEEKIKI